jgi:phage gp29-like protein
MREWRLWVAEVLMPMNLSQEKIILNSAHLIREQEVPECLLNFVAHIAAWKAVLKKWEVGDFSEQFSLVAYPTEVADYAASAYRELKAEQLRLIGRKQ